MRRTYRVPLFEMKLVVVVADAPHVDYHIPANRVAREHGVPLPYPGEKGVLVDGCQWRDPHTGRIYVIVSSRASVNTIVHEASHAAQSVVDATALPRRVKNQDNEQYAYLVGWIAQRIYDTVHRKHSAADAAAQRSAARL